MANGKVVAIRGVVVDVMFPAGEMPEILDALEIDRENGDVLVLEVQQQLGEGLVRTVAMGSTDGLARGATVRSTGSPIKVPVGPKTLGRIFNVVGEAIDGRPTPETEVEYAIHRPAPDFEDQSGEAKTFETGMKVLDLLAPLLENRKGEHRQLLAEMQAAVDLPIIASGGVANRQDVARLAALGVAGCIIGRALYEGTIDLGEAVAASGE